MALTNGQLTTLKAYILADSTLAAWAATGRMAEEIAHELNHVAAPEWVVWKTDVHTDDIMRNGMDWTRVDNLTVGKARIWDWLSRLGTFDASRANIRAGIDATWVGTAADLAVRATVYTHCKRAATRAEKALSTGTGTTASPATMTFEGALTYSDVEAALGA
jgi:hypothetical protein